MSIDDQIRTATQAFGATVREVRPLDLPAPVKAAREPRRPRASRHWMTWGIPLAAAAAVVAIALSLAAIHRDNTMPVRPPVPGGSPGIPRYFVAMKMAGTSGSRALIVGDDQAGTVIATVPAPRGVFFGGPQFGGVASAGDDRTFVVTGVSDRVYTYYLLRLAPGSAHPYRLTRLPIAPVAASDGPALSPDGRKLAIETTAGATDSRLSIYSVASGKALRTWRLKTASSDGIISWRPDSRHVVFSVWGSSATEVRTLDVTAHGTDMLAASRVLLTIPTSVNCASTQLSLDGRTVVCVTQWGVQSPPPGGATEAPVCSVANKLRFLSYSVRTGQLARVLYTERDPCHPSLAAAVWMDASASRVIGAVMFPTNSPDLELLTVGRLGLITKAGGFQPVKLPKAVTAQDYPYLAF